MSLPGSPYWLVGSGFQQVDLSLEVIVGWVRGRNKGTGGSIIQILQLKIFEVLFQDLACCLTFFGILYIKTGLQATNKKNNCSDTLYYLMS